MPDEPVRSTPHLDLSESDPIRQFTRWFDDANARSGMRNPEMMHLATFDPDRGPQGRIVLLKEVDSRGFAFYTNLDSDKGHALAAEPRAALTFYWEALGRQARVEGAIVRVSDEEADAYFATRPRGSQIGAWASDQSRPLESRAHLDDRVGEAEARFEGSEVSRPPHWSGYRLVPNRIEFWQEAESRLHDRVVYVRDEGGWESKRLYP